MTKLTTDRDPFKRRAEDNMLTMLQLRDLNKLNVSTIWVKKTFENFPKLLKVFLSNKECLLCSLLANKKENCCISSLQSKMWGVAWERKLNCLVRPSHSIYKQIKSPLKPQMACLE